MANCESLDKAKKEIDSLQDLLHGSRVETAAHAERVEQLKAELEAANGELLLRAAKIATREEHIKQLQAQNATFRACLMKRTKAQGHWTDISRLKAELKTTKTERNILAMLASDNPQFFNPTGIFEAKVLRDRILKR